MQGQGVSGVSSGQLTCCVRLAGLHSGPSLAIKSRLLIRKRSDSGDISINITILIWSQEAVQDCFVSRVDPLLRRPGILLIEVSHQVFSIGHLCIRFYSGC